MYRPRFPPSGGRVARGLRDSFERQEYCGVARAMRAGGREDVEAGPRAGIVAAAREIIGKRGAGFGNLGGGAADDVGTHQRGGCLSQRTSADLLAERGDPAVTDVDVDRDPAPADLRALFGAAVRRGEPPLMRDRGRETQNPCVVERDVHGDSSINRAGGMTAKLMKLIVAMRFRFSRTRLVAHPVWMRSGRWGFAASSMDAR